METDEVFKFAKERHYQYDGSEIKALEAIATRCRDEVAEILERYGFQEKQ